MSELPCRMCKHLMSDVDGHRLEYKIENPIKVAGRACLDCQREIAQTLERLRDENDRTHP